MKLIAVLGRTMASAVLAALASSVCATPARASDSNVRAGSPADRATAIEWRLAHYLPAEHFFARWLANWAATIERDTGGRLRIAIAPNNELLRLGAIAPGVREGKAALGFGPAPEAPEFAALGLPFLANAATDGTRLVNALARDGAFAVPLRGLDVVLLQTNAPSVVHSARVPLRRPADLRGLRMRGATPYIRALLSAFGATPVEGFLAPQVYGALSAGKVDGTVFPYEAMGVFRLGEQLRWHTDVPLFVSVLGLYMNPAAYTELPADLREVLDRHRGEVVARAAAEAWDDEERRGRDIVQALGNHRLQPTSAELGEWQARGAEFTAAQLERLGPVARAVHARALELTGGTGR